MVTPYNLTMLAHHQVTPYNLTMMALPKCEVDSTDLR